VEAESPRGLTPTQPPEADARDAVLNAIIELASRLANADANEVEPLANAIRSLSESYRHGLNGWNPADMATLASVGVQLLEGMKDLFGSYSATAAQVTPDAEK